MNSVSFPKVFRGNQTQIIEGTEATGTCLRLFISSEEGSLFGDPGFGVLLKKFTFDPNSSMLKELLRNELFEKIQLFFPQLTILRRDDIKIKQDKQKISIKIKVINKIDFQPSTYDLQIFNEEER